MNGFLKWVLAGVAMLCAGCASLELYAPVVKTEPFYQEGKETHAVVVMGVNLPAGIKAVQLIMYAGGKIISGKGISEPGFKPDRLMGDIFFCEWFKEIDAQSHAYVIWQVSKEDLKKHNKAIAYPNNISTGNNKNTARKFFNGLTTNCAAAPVNVTRPNDFWYTYAPVFMIEAPGIYYLGEMNLKPVTSGPNDSLQITSSADHEKFKAFLATQNLAGADYIDQSNSWIKIRSSDFLGYTSGEK